MDIPPLAARLVEMQRTLRFSPRDVRAIQGIPKWQLEYFVREGIVRPVEPGRQGSDRMFSFVNLLEVAFGASLVRWDIPAKRVGQMFDDLRDVDNGSSLVSGFDFLLVYPDMSEVLAVVLNRGAFSEPHDVEDRHLHLFSKAQFTTSQSLNQTLRIFPVMSVPVRPILDLVISQIEHYMQTRAVGRKHGRPRKAPPQGE